MKRGGELTKQILLLLLAGALTTSPRQSRYIWSRIFKLLFGAKKPSPKLATPELVRRRFHYLRQQHFISYMELRDGTVQIKLTDNGRTRALQYKLDDMHIPKPARWDGKWRLAIFDVPEHKRNARDALRAKLKELGFILIQKSVWVYPFPCQDEIAFIAHVFDLTPNLFLAEATIKNDGALREWFGV